MNPAPSGSSPSERAVFSFEVLGDRFHSSARCEGAAWVVSLLLGKRCGRLLIMLPPPLPPLFSTCVGFLDGVHRLMFFAHCVAGAIDTHVPRQ